MNVVKYFSYKSLGLVRNNTTSVAVKIFMSKTIKTMRVSIMCIFVLYNLTSCRMQGAGGEDKAHVSLGDMMGDNTR